MNPRTMPSVTSTAVRRPVADIRESRHSVVDVPTIGQRSIIILGEIVKRSGFWFPDLCTSVIKRY